MTKDRNSIETVEPSRQVTARTITEGQLRWAQFHHRRRAQQVQKNIQALYKTPLTVNEVDGAVSDDGNSSSASSSCGREDGNEEDTRTAITRPRRQKPKVSRGRRALLRVSQRRFRDRSEKIRKFGFSRTGDGAKSSSSSENEEEEDALACIFAETSVWKRRKRKKKHNNGNGNDNDRSVRFDQAFHALMMNVAAAQQPQFATVQTPTKIWSRPAETPQINVNYDAMKQMGIPTLYRKSMKQSSALPMDRGASWLVHLPKTEKASNDARRVAATTNAAFAVAADYEEVEILPPDFTSPVRQRFRDIVTDFQSNSAVIPESKHQTVRQPPTMRLQKYFAQLEDDTRDEKKVEGSPLGATHLDFKRVQEQLQIFEKRPPSDDEELEQVLKSIDPNFLEEMEALNPGVKDRLKALYLRESSPSVKQLARIIETPVVKLEKRRGLVREFVERMEKASQKENLISADGKLHKPTFAKLINHYLMEAKGSSVSPRRRQPVLDNLVSKFQESEETDSLIDIKGQFDTPLLENLVTRYLAELTGQDEDDIRDAENWESLQTEAYRERSPFVRSTARQMRQQVVTRVPRGEEEWCKIVETSMVAALPHNKSVTPPPWAVKRLAERCAALVPEAWEQINTIEEVIEDELEEAEKIHHEGFLSPCKPVTPDGFSTPQATNSVPTPQVKRFIIHMEQAAEVEPLVQNGKFHMPTFTKMVNRYWSESGEDSADFNNLRTPVLLARAKRSSVVGKAVVHEKSISPGSVKRFIAAMECAVQQSNLVDDHGFLDHGALDELVAEELLKASVAEAGGDSGGRSESIGEDDENLDWASVVSTDESDFFSVIRRNLEQRQPSKSMVSELTFDSPKRNSLFPVDCSDSVEKEQIESKYDRPDRSVVRSVTGAMTEKVGGMIGRLFQKKDDPSTQHRDDMQAIAAFRKTTDQRRLSADDSSSLSSFRALPDGIKNVVMNFRRVSGAASEPIQVSVQESFDDHMSHATEAVASNFQSVSSGEQTEFSPERVKAFNQKVMERSALIGGAEISRAIIDTDGSEASYDGVNPGILASLLMSPTILTKRHQQAIRAIEKRNWEQVSYLINANPWLCEMTDVATNQYLLHKLSLYGGGESDYPSSGGVSITRYHPAPPELNTAVVRLFPSAVHKFDQDGNLPLHMACAAANASMVEILGHRFPSGATVRNEDGLLPIHLVILACGSPRAVSYGDAAGATELIRTLLNYFPASVAITDDEGNLPIHTAASVLRDDVGVDVIHLLLDEAARQLKDPYGARFRNKISIEDLESTSDETYPTEIPIDPLDDLGDITQCTFVYNDVGETPLLSAIHARAGWEVIDALVQCAGGQASALVTDRHGNNALHLLVSEEYQDPAAASSILKSVPEAARRRNDVGMLPIEIASMQQFASSELILAIVLVDLPIELDSKESIKFRDKQGSSWWYLVCESDDHFVGVVEEVISMCSYAQIRELCFMEGHRGETLIARATPKCRAALQKGIRFLGRFEFVGQSALLSDPSRGIKLFDAIDYGPTKSPFDIGRRVILKCYADEKTFLEESRLSREVTLDSMLFEELALYSVGENGSEIGEGPKQFCISIERPQLTLGSVVQGMLGNHDCQTNEEIRTRYATKVFSVLRIVGKALAQLHASGLVHGNISLTHVGKYETKWKVAEVLSLQRIGETFDPDRYSPSSPPESLVPRHSETHQAEFRTDLVTSAAIDIWAYGKLAYEGLVGEPLVMFEEASEFDDDHKALMDILHWNEFNLNEVADKLRRSAVLEIGVSLIVSCLSPLPEARPSIDEIMEHPVWKELRRVGKMPH